MKLVDTLLTSYKQMNEKKFDSSIRIIQGKIDYAEKRIDETGYSLYGLTEEEIGVAEK